MQNSFWKSVGVPTEVKTIEKKTLTESVRSAFSDDSHCFYNSRWFIDVKNRFRIFGFNGVTYIVKEMSEKKADIEIVNSRKAYDKLDGKMLGMKRIRIVIPQKIVLFIGGNRYFLSSEYLGPDLNENAYTNKLSGISKDLCLSLIKLFLENGISYRGFLPRNIIEKKEDIYLFDWEDASFCETFDTCTFDRLWRTNFLLNWSYLFDFDQLDEGLRTIVGIRYPLEEPEFVKYENTFRAITRSMASDTSLRDTIDKVVFGAELPSVKSSQNFCMHPNDIGHFVADVFQSEIDVLYDILSYIYRRNGDYIFSRHIEFMTNMLTKYYKESLVQNRIPKSYLQYYSLIPLLMMLDQPLAEQKYIDMLSSTSINEIIANLSSEYPKGAITNSFLVNDKAEMENSLLDKICQMIKEISQNCVIEENSKEIQSIVNFVIETSSSVRSRV